MAVVQNNLREAIQKIKDEQGYSQKELAPLVAMDEGKLSRFLRMDSSELVSIKVLQALFKNFKLSPNDVLLVEDED